jgi:nucleoside-diphosphate-sugar epimerase
VDVVVAGGHGKIGLRLLRLLASGGHRARGIVRKPEQEADVRDAGAEAIVLDLENAEPEQVARAIEGADAAVFAAGAGPGSGPERKWTVDYGAAAKLIEACKQDGITRYAIVSSVGADDPEATGAEGDYLVYFQAKQKADEELMASGLDYTVVRPHGLTNERGTGRVQIGQKLDRGRVSRDDVAAVLLACLEHDNTIKKAFELTSGDAPVDDAVGSL